MNKPRNYDKFIQLIGHLPLSESIPIAKYFGDSILEVEIEIFQEALNRLLNTLNAKGIIIPSEIKEVMHEQYNHYTELKNNLLQ